LQTHASNKKIGLTIFVASLGYFVDIYDLQLFNMVSKKSLMGIGITDPGLIDKYDYMLFLWQMGGMLAGGLLWGILGDKKGRKSILFGSILTYSLANIANAFVVDVDQYAAVRFFAGLGLAGELGAAITLVSEIMDKEKRGYGTMIIVSTGALGAVFGAFVAMQEFALFGLQSWQTSYIIGGLLGILLLFLRFGTLESGMFNTTQETGVSRGNFFHLFATKERALRYLSCIAVGLPIWFCVGILIKFSGKISVTNGVTGGPVDMLTVLILAYIGLSSGDLLSGILSQWFKSRKTVIYIYLTTTLLVSLLFLYWTSMSIHLFYAFCFLLGAATGYWALFVQVASEQFGTNIRATATTTAPNFVRGAVVPMVLCYKSMEVSCGSITSALIVGLVTFALAFWALRGLRESFSKDLNYTE
jgi:MFS transporter, putative metabolite:H+ symporter